MKALGIVRKIDELGRIVIPIEVRKTNGWSANQPMEMFVDDDGGLYIKAYGKDAEKQEIIEQLNQVAATTNNAAVLQIVSKAVEFINR